jgi:hypothetical protein
MLVVCVRIFNLLLFIVVLVLQVMKGARALGKEAGPNRMSLQTLESSFSVKQSPFRAFEKDKAQLVVSAHSLPSVALSILNADLAEVIVCCRNERQRDALYRSFTAICHGHTNHKMDVENK